MFQYNWLKKLLLLGVLALSLSLTGCPGKGEQKPITPPVKIGISLAGMERDGNQIIKKVMNERRRKDRVNLIWQDAQNDPDKQQKQIEQLLEQNVKVVILQLVDPSMGPDIVPKLTEKGVKVLALETLPANTPLDGYIASDHRRVGELQARYVLQQAAAAGKPFRVLVLQGDPLDLAARDITAANEEVLKGNPQVAELRVKDHLQAEPGLARTTVEEILTGGTPDAILANDSRLAVAAVEVLKAKNLNERVVTVGVGADKKASEGIAAGDHEAEVDNSPELLAQYLMDAAVDLAQKDHWQYNTQVQNGQYDIPAKITPVRLITKDELYLLTDRWGNLKDKAKKEEQQSGQQGGQENAGSNSGSSTGGSLQSSGQDSGDGQGSERQKPKTTLRIKTQDGKTMEVEIDGEVKTIETREGGNQQQGQQSGQEGQ
ncbi:substrate-binding domain-containing protein [Desulfolucanica intricata]|uniref:substrate-binding domain-containing protein n=1 Tax=Desulfolucanica intricata TaxID=1285191 RepID=UPI0008317C55|nr:substrate-binding domain-containing protein [Desulfolucanica intricata]